MQSSMGMPGATEPTSTAHSRPTRRFLLTAGAAAASGALLDACGQGGTAGKPETGGAAPSGVPNRPVTLSYLNWFGPADPQNVLFPHALQTFQQKHPQVTVEQVVASGSVMEKYLALAAAGTTPDLATLNPQFVEPLRARGALADITSYVKRDAKTWQPEDFNEAALLRAQKNGKWHAIPLQMGLWFVLYNTGTFDQAGVSKPDASWTWDKVVESLRAIRSRDQNNLGMSRPPYELPVRSNGGDILTADEKKCLLDQPAAVEAIQWNADLSLKHRVVATADEMAGLNARQAFDQGKLAYHIGDPGFLSQTQRGKLNFAWNLAVVPKGKVSRVSTVKGPSLIMSQESKEKDTTWAWLAHYTSAEMQKYVAVEGKVVSARTSALKAYVALDEGINKQALVEVAAVAKPMPYVARYDEMDKEIGAGLSAVNSGQRPAKEAMAEVARKVNEILAAI